MRSIKESCLERLILFGEASLRRAIPHFMPRAPIVGPEEVFRIKLQMRREALGKLDRFASERNSVTVRRLQRVLSQFCQARRQNGQPNGSRHRVTIVESRSPRQGRLAQPVRAPALQAGGRWFDPVTAHHDSKELVPSAFHPFSLILCLTVPKLCQNPAQSGPVLCQNATLLHLQGG